MSWLSPAHTGTLSQIGVRFGKVPWSAIHKQEMYAWLYWSIFNQPYTTLEALPHAHQVALKDVIGLMEARAGCAIPDGSNPAVKPLLLTLDPVSVVWRPFAWYAFVAVINLFLRRRMMRTWDCKFGTYHGLEYVQFTFLMQVVV